ncbi:MAG: hypothetical protein GWM90_12530 [Gemmatimonadetes bacterium]|nr:hypothetical protein [Gemmatimonadota bacterium]NIQ58148.1 hypothetical protein [Gemmatimonadota bacterium]NIU78353.1 hypothetical protein [Gammaproteobacteria bacterium]NIX44909.1 hypothetical protein [Gemmatimonadota bacterium]NIY09152.1 hypothetical protein [Gemmatimonadota bacterium]
MPTHVLRLAILFLIAGFNVSCIYPRQGRTVPGDAMVLESRGAAVFAQYLIPVAERATDRRVRSGWFRADQTWGQAALLAERVYCGRDEDGRPRAEYMPVEMSVTLRLGMRSGGTRLSLDSEGRTVAGVDSDGEEARCRLRAEFAEELLAVIAGDWRREPFGPDIGVGPEVWRPRH